MKWLLIVLAIIPIAFVGVAALAGAALIVLEIIRDNPLRNGGYLLFFLWLIWGVVYLHLYLQSL